MYKLKREMGEYEKRLIKLKTDNTVMRQDISTYECNAASKIGFFQTCAKLERTVK